MINIIIAVFLIVWASYNLGKYSDRLRIYRFIRDNAHFNNDLLTGKSGEYRQGFLAALSYIRKEVE